jgi:hypothetical protein
VQSIRCIMQAPRIAYAFSILALGLSVFGSEKVSAQVDSIQAIPANRVVWQHVGRLYLNPDAEKAVYVGYLVHLNRTTESLFDGAPSEASAYFTFSTDVLSLTPLPSNGNVGLNLVSAGTFSVYYNERPNANWNDPSTFSSGRLIATFVRQESLFPLLGSIGTHNLTETLGSSHSISFDGQTIDFKHLTPNGITFAQFLNGTPFSSGITNYPLAFAVAGTTTAVGEAQ